MKNPIKPKEQSVHTSVSLALTHLEMLKTAAKEHDLSVNDLMVLLLRYADEHPIGMPDKQPRVKYQDSGLAIQIVNLYVSQRDYERNVDARRFGKVSVSWLLAYAIEHFLNVVIRKIMEGLSFGIKVLNNYLRPQATLIKKTRKRIKMVSVWYPMRT